jgi:hypothetical protein
MGTATKTRNEVLWQIGVELSERFRPFQPGTIPDKSWTLHKAVRNVFGTNSSWGLVAYENHHELRSQIGATYAALDQALQEQGDTGRAEPWGLSKDRTAEEMVKLCERAATLVDADSPRLIHADSRRAISGLRGVGKYRGAICSVVAEVAGAQGVGFGEIVDEVASLRSITDTELLDQLELLPRNAPDTNTDADAVSTSIWSGRWLGSRGNRMSDYFIAVRTMLGPWADLSGLADALEEVDEKLKA